MKNLRLLALLLIASPAVLAQNQYNVTLDLKNVKNDQVKVVVQTPEVEEKEVTYIIPSVIPGSYSKKDYGRFITDFKAYNKKGRKLKTRKQGENLYVIEKADKLHRLEYLVNDTWDTDIKDNYIFQPGGTNIEAGKNFVINHFGYYGYLDGQKTKPYQVTVQKPAELYGATALQVQRQSPEKDVITADSYVKLVDSPILYSRPDTAGFWSGNTWVSVAVHSETGLVKAEQVREMIRPLATALTSFFGQMPVDRYHFLMYFTKNGESNITRYGGFGALEHSYSSFYFLPEMENQDNLRQMVLDVASHEFLHILTPLNIHSEEIEYFDFKDPKLSRHLWLYEGVTEYFANLVQLQEGLVDYTHFQDQIHEKIGHSTKYPNVSFTEMSRQILEPEYKDMYQNVYQKGALLGFLLDIRLRELSKGQMGLRELMLQLSQKYGPNKPFKDEALISEITAMTYPEIGKFFADYVEGNKPLPYQEYFNKIGWNYYKTKQDSALTFGDMRLSYVENPGVFVVSEALDNTLGLKQHDILLSVNGTDLNIDNVYQLLGPVIEVTSAEPVTLTFARGKEMKKVQASPVKKPVEKEHVIENNPNATEAQLQLRSQVLKNVPKS
ncbi:MAG: peptidase M61 [Hymenobacteraceae bacterium]|nr:peptidase M61 [Hymenobacteraceae bacterium]MDX5395111.1 peptidase M61 [Hymenobacteraceae bacterium]MDX5511149.1 peptidase M61 [Hymenobacteraceae bacterium]